MAPSAAGASTQATERAKAIETSGRTGVWITPAAICMRDAKAGRKATLGWNVKARGTGHVIAFVLDKHGDEARFAQAGPIGERQTGAWLRPGLAFRLRDADSHALLGSVVVADASCD